MFSPKGFAGTVAANLVIIAEIGQHIRVAPSGDAILRPGIEVARMPSHVSHVIEPGRASKHFAPAAREPVVS